MGIHSEGLQCVTVLIGAYDIASGHPVIGVINQPFATQDLISQRYVGIGMSWKFWVFIHPLIRPLSRFRKVQLRKSLIPKLKFQLMLFLCCCPYKFDCGRNLAIFYPPYNSSIPAMSPLFRFGRRPTLNYISWQVLICFQAFPIRPPTAFFNLDIQQYMLWVLYDTRHRWWHWTLFDKQVMIPPNCIAHCLPVLHTWWSHKFSVPVSCQTVCI